MSKYKISCPVCDNPDVIEEVKPAFHEVYSGKSILVIGLPNFQCEECKTVTYRKSFGMVTILNEAYKNDYNVIIFNEKDWVDLLD